MHQPGTDPAAERTVLGALLEHPDLFPDVQSDVDALDFADPFRREALGALVALAERGEPTDPAAVAALMVARGQSCKVAQLFDLQGVGGHELARLGDKAERLQQLADCRTLVDRCKDVAGSLREAEADPRAWLDKAIASLTIDRREAIQTVSMKAACEAVLNRTKTPDIARKDCTWIGIAALRHVLGWLEPTALYIVSALTSGGKSALAMNLAHDAQDPQPTPTLYWSGEMTADQVAERAIAREARVNAATLHGGGLGDEKRQAVIEAVARLGKHPIEFVHDAIDVGEFRSLVLRMRRRNPTGPMLAVYDYVQIGKPTGRHDVREQEVAEISATLKATAVDARCPVVALSQLNDDGRTRESRALENDADAWINVELGGENGDDERRGEVKVRKNRRGKCGKQPVVFSGQFVSFS